MTSFIVGFATLCLTIGAYAGAKLLNKKFPSPFTLPILTSTAFIICLLLAMNVSYETFMTGGQWVDYLLEPGVVALAYPLYRQWQTLKANFIPIFTGVFVGAVIGVISGVLLAKWFGFEKSIIYSLTPKSVTTPVAMTVAENIDGIPAIAAAMVMIAGIGGAFIGLTLFKWTGITHPISRGIGMGSASHAIGTSKMMESSEEAGAASTVAMILAAIIVSIITPLLVLYLM